MCCVLKPDYSKDEPYIKSLDITWRLIRHEESQVSFCIYSFGICILKVPQVFKFTVLWSWRSTVLDRLTIADNYWALLTMDCLLNLFNNLYFSHFTVEQIEAQRSWVTCSKSNQAVWLQDLCPFPPCYFAHPYMLLLRRSSCCLAHRRDCQVRSIFFFLIYTT